MINVLKMVKFKNPDNFYKNDLMLATLNTYGDKVRVVWVNGKSCVIYEDDLIIEDVSI